MHEHDGLSLGTAAGTVTPLLIGLARGTVRDLPSLLSHVLGGVLVGVLVKLVSAWCVRRWPHLFAPPSPRNSLPPPGGEPPAPSAR